MTRASLVCPRCHALLDETDPLTRCCPQDGLIFHRVEGIWRMLLPERGEVFSRFIRDYEIVRRSEGRGSADGTYYRTLPYHSSPDWRIRSKSFDVFVRKVLAPMEIGSKSLDIIDLGAGNGWLSNQLALRGHNLTAVDLTVNDFDGLGCHRFYASHFTPVQAEFDFLPVPEKAMDVVLFNASFHYSVNYRTTLVESLRILKDPGVIVLLDSPVYHDPESGRRMVNEREAQFTRKYGFPSDNLQSGNYLTYARLQGLARELNVSPEILTPSYGLRWALRPVIARLLGRREPAKFHVVVFHPAKATG